MPARRCRPGCPAPGAARRVGPRDRRRPGPVGDGDRRAATPMGCGRVGQHPARRRRPRPGRRPGRVRRPAAPAPAGRRRGPTAAPGRPPAPSAGRRPRPAAGPPRAGSACDASGLRSSWAASATKARCALAGRAPAGRASTFSVTASAWISSSAAGTGSRSSRPRAARSAPPPARSSSTGRRAAPTTRQATGRGRQQQREGDQQASAAGCPGCAVRSVDRLPPRSPWPARRHRPGVAATRSSDRTTPSRDPGIDTGCAARAAASSSPGSRARSAGRRPAEALTTRPCASTTWTIWAPVTGSGGRQPARRRPGRPPRARWRGRRRPGSAGWRSRAPRRGRGRRSPGRARAPAAPISSSRVRSSVAAGATAASSTEPVAGAADGLDQPRAQLAAQVADVDLDRVGVASVACTSQTWSSSSGLGHHPVGVAEEVLQRARTPAA